MKTGRPLPLVDLRIVDEEMAEQPQDGASTSEVVVRAPWLTAECEESGGDRDLWRDFIYTGDVGHIDADGSLITDRMKDVIKSGGEWCPRWHRKPCLCHRRCG